MTLDIAVIVPMFNASKTIARTLSSIVNQTYPITEVIVVDDVSTDNSQQVVQEFFAGISSTKLKLISSRKNSGPGSARNRGIAATSCTLLAFLDADDTWQPKHLENSIAVLEAVDVHRSAVVQQPVQKTDDTQDELRYHRFNPLYYFFFQKNCSIITLVVSRSLVLEAGLFPEQRRYGEDYHFFVRLFTEARRCLCIDSPHTAVVGKHPFASRLGLSSQRFHMYVGTLLSTFQALRMTRYAILIPLLFLWHTFKLAVRFARVAYYERTTAESSS